jgi:hypothetical protein
LTKKAVRTLSKQSWKRRFVVVASLPTPSGAPSQASLRYYNSPSKLPLKHSLSLGPGTAVTRSSEHGRPFEFLVRTADGTCFFACADSDAEADAWVFAIETLISSPSSAKPPSMSPLPPPIAPSPAKPTSMSPLPPPILPPLAKPTSMSPLPPPIETPLAATTFEAASSVVGAASAASSPATGNDSSKIISIFDIIKRVESRVAKVLVAGANDGGQLGISSVTNAGICSPEQITALKQKLEPTVLSCGYRHSAAITANDSLMIWGDGAGAY